MRVVALIICLLLSVVGALGVASPARLVSLVRSFQTPVGLLFAAALRVVLGVALFFSAPGSRAPELIGVVGIATIVMGVITPFFGVERFRRLLDSWSAQGSVFLRGWAILAMLLGLSLMYAITPAV
jgi:hypothetical protein